MQKNNPQSTSLNATALLKSDNAIAELQNNLNVTILQVITNLLNICTLIDRDEYNIGRI